LIRVEKKPRRSKESEADERLTRKSSVIPKDRIRFVVYSALGKKV
jgi:hypothetical protein